MKKSWMILISVVLTLFFAAFQRMTGPTHPEDGFVEGGDERVAFSLPRSGTVGEDTRIAVPAKPCRGGLAMSGRQGRTGMADTCQPETSGSLPVQDSACPGGDASCIESNHAARLHYRHYPFLDGEAWMAVPMRQEDDYWVAFLPSQPMAGKLAYYVEADGVSYHQDAPLIIRYKGSVPAAVLVPHILLMFLAMFFAVMAGLAALLNNPLYKRYSVVTLVLLVLGGLVFGCLVQKHAFDVYWAGFPMGGDLTDNKTLIAVLAFLIAVACQFLPRKKSLQGSGAMPISEPAFSEISKRKAVMKQDGKPGNETVSLESATGKAAMQGGKPASLSGDRSWPRWVVLAAAIVMLGIFSVPHSTNGSELDRATGESVRAE